MKKHLRTLEKFGFVFGTIAFVVWGLMQMWQHTNFMRTDASLKKLKSELPKKVDDRTTLVDVDFERYQVMDLKGTNVTFFVCHRSQR